MEVTRVWKVYGANGHRQRASFAPSATYDWSSEGDVRKVALENADMTGTNEYVIIRITRNPQMSVKGNWTARFQTAFLRTVS